MISKLAEDIYEKSIHFKKFSFGKLLLKKNRLMLEKEIFETKELVQKLVLAIRDNSDYTNDYFELALFMDETLSECVRFLTSKGKNYRETVRRYICGFYNLPKAFFDLENTMRISPNEALENYKPYLKLD